MKIKYIPSGFIAVIKLNRAIKKDVLPKNSRKLYKAVKMAGMIDKVNPK